MSLNRGEQCPYVHCSKRNGWWQLGDNHEFIVIYLTNGLLQVKARCRWCKIRSGAIPENVYREWGIEPESLPVLTPAPTEITCVVDDCRTPGYEMHHFAPGAVFLHESDRWPYLPLCRPHHVEWHQRMNGYHWGRPE